MANMVIVVSAVLVLSFSIRFALCDLVTLIFNLGDFSFSRFGFNVRTDRQNHTHTHTHTHTDAASRLTHATVIDMGFDQYDACRISFT